MHTYYREPGEECARSWNYIFLDSSETSEIGFLPFGLRRRSNRFRSSKIKQQDQHEKLQMKQSREYIIPLRCVTSLLSVGLVMALAPACPALDSVLST